MPLSIPQTTFPQTTFPVEEETVGLRLRVRSPEEVSVDAGGTLDDSESIYIQLQEEIAKNIRLPWSVGTGNGGRYTNSSKTSHLHIWVVYSPDYGVDVVFSENMVNPPIPGSYTKKKRLGTVIIDSNSRIQSIL